MLCKHLSVIKPENNNIKPPDKIPSSKLKNIHVRIAFIPIFSLLIANFSDTITVTAMFKPEVATVIKNKYTDITKLKTPTASVPIWFEMYTLKIRVANLMDKAVIVNIVPFIKNNLLFSLTKYSPLQNILELWIICLFLWITLYELILILWI